MYSASLSSDPRSTAGTGDDPPPNGNVENVGLVAADAEDVAADNEDITAVADRVAVGIGNVLGSNG